MKQPVAGAGVQGCGPPKLASAVKPTLGYVVAKLTSAVLIVRSEPAAEDSLADILARIKFGIAMAAMIRMIATTISNSIREKPFCLFICFSSGIDSSASPLVRWLRLNPPEASRYALECGPEGTEMSTSRGAFGGRKKTERAVCGPLRKLHPDGTQLLERGAVG